MKALKWVAGLITQNIWWKLLSLIIAVLLWSMVASEGDVSTYVTARVNLKNLPDSLELSAEPPSTVTLELTGPATELRRIGDGGQHPEVLLDMANMTPGQHTFPISENNVKLSRGIHILLAIPSQVRFDFEDRMTRTVPVRARITGAPPKGYTVSVSTTPAEMEIVGPRTHVVRIDSVVTDPVDVSGLAGISQFKVNAYIGDPFVRFEAAPQVVVTITAKPAAGK
jgi:YbbR domain-containing protein